MSKVAFEVPVSVDCYLAGPNASLEEPLGAGSAASTTRSTRRCASSVVA